jgi:ribonucleoside-triphosphate reductase
MKVIKRDGSIVDYNSLKIVSALEKANKEVQEEERILKKEIRRIIRYIEKLDKKRILVEDIQDIIEMKLMEFGKYVLAKKYIVYRYNRALVRKQNTTDESILSLIKNQKMNMDTENTNKNAKLVSAQRDLIAGEVSRDLTKRILLPENIVTAHEKGILYFHDSAYFLQPIFNSSFIQIQDMFDKGTVMNYKEIKSPKSFSVACNIMTQIIASTSSSQYGEQAISVIPFGKYVHISEEKYREELKEIVLSKEKLEEIVKRRLEAEIEVGVQTIEYQINTLMTANGQSPPLTLILELDDKDLYIEETACVIEEILKRRLKGMKERERGMVIPDFPKLVYVLSEVNTGNGKYAYLTTLALQCAKIQSGFRFLSKKMAIQNYKEEISLMGSSHFLIGNTKSGCFNEGVVTLNLPQIAFLSNKDEIEFFRILKERMELAIDTLLRRHYALLGTSATVSPLHYQYGAIARLQSEEKIDDLLQENVSTLSLGYVGLKETVWYMRGSTFYEKNGKSLALKILKSMHSQLDKARKTHLGFVLYQSPSKMVASYFYDIDRMHHLGKISEYTVGFGMDRNYPYKERLKVENEFHVLTSGGSVSQVAREEIIDEKEFIETIYNTNVYVEVVKEKGEVYHENRCKDSSY